MQKKEEMANLLSFRKSKKIVMGIKNICIDGITARSLVLHVGADPRGV